MLQGYTKNIFRSIQSFRTFGQVFSEMFLHTWSNIMLYSLEMAQKNKKNSGSWYIGLDTLLPLLGKLCGHYTSIIDHVSCPIFRANEKDSCDASSNCMMHTTQVSVSSHRGSKQFSQDQTTPTHAISHTTDWIRVRKIIKNKKHVKEVYTKIIHWQCNSFQTTTDRYTPLKCFEMTKSTLSNHHHNAFRRWSVWPVLMNLLLLM